MDNLRISCVSTQISTFTCSSTYGIVRTMNQLSIEKRTAVVAALVEGNSLRGTARLTGVARMTIEKLLRDLGAACAAYHDANVRGLKSRRIQCDEIWAFVGAKQKNVPEEKRGQWGDIWTWTAIDADSKMIVGYHIGQRTATDAHTFMSNVAARLNHRVQLTTDSLKVYLNAVEDAFHADIDYAILEKHFGTASEGRSTSLRYSPAKMTSMSAARVTGNPNPRHISTSFVERQNLTMRMHMRRFTRLTNGFSKKVEMHAHSVALHFMYYNFCKVHQSLRVTPAMEAGLTTRVWDLQDLVALLETDHQSAQSA
jgi:IS1 family transposase